MEDFVPNLYLLTKCDMKCGFCYASKDLGEMGFNDVARVIDDFKKSGVKRVNITGGEVMLYKAVKDVVKYAFNKGIKVTLFTSGSLLNRESIHEFNQYVDWWALSLDGDKEINRAMGRAPKHYERALTSLECLRGIDAKVRLTTVVNEVNLFNLEEVAKILNCKKNHPTLWRIKEMVPTRAGGELYKQQAVSSSSFKDVTSKIVVKYGGLMKIDAISLDMKSGDTMCVHPDGEATLTLDDNGMKIVSLGNMIDDSNLVIENWYKKRSEKNSLIYSSMWEIE